MQKITDADSISFEGHSGTVYEFFAYPLKATLPPVGGIYVVARRTDNRDNGGSMQLLFIGQSDNFADSAARFCEEQDIMNDPDVRFCMHLEDADHKKRQAICEDLRTRYLPSADR